MGTDSEGVQRSEYKCRTIQSCSVLVALWCTIREVSAHGRHFTGVILPQWGKKPQTPLGCVGISEFIWGSGRWILRDSGEDNWDYKASEKPAEQPRCLFESCLPF